MIMDDSIPALERLLPLPVKIGMYCFHSAFSSRLGEDVSAWGNLDHVPVPLAAREFGKASILCGIFQLLLR